MKGLIIMRHAKAETYSDSGLDFDRPLSDRGKQDAATMAKRLLHKKIIPTQIICSSAKRTHKTAKILAEVLGLDKTAILPIESLYQADAHEVLNTLRQVNNYEQTIVMVGHNPTVTSLVGLLCNQYAEGLTTAAQAYITFNMKHWQEITEHHGQLIWMDYPKNM